MQAGGPRAPRRQLFLGGHTCCWGLPAARPGCPALSPQPTHSDVLGADPPAPLPGTAPPRPSIHCRPFEQDRRRMDRQRTGPGRRLSSPHTGTHGGRTVLRRRGGNPSSNPGSDSPRRLSEPQLSELRKGDWRISPQGRAAGRRSSPGAGPHLPRGPPARPPRASPPGSAASQPPCRAASPVETTAFPQPGRGLGAPDCSAELGEKQK